MAFIGEIPSSSGLSTMKQMAMNFAAPFIPDEIMYEILKRLPVKSLKRFQCVCVQWKNLFNKPSFIADHSRHSGHHNPNFLFFKASGFEPLRLHLLDCEMRVRVLQNAPPFHSLYRRLVKVIGSSNGLLCISIRKSELQRYPSSVLLWNPATRDVRELPRSRTIHSRLLSCVIGFGFNSSVNDYKIVAIAKMSGGSLEVGVYSLSSDSWKEIKFENFLEHLTFHSFTVVNSNRAIFWEGLTVAREKVLVSFDTAKEVFSLIPWPRLRIPTSFKTLFTSLTIYKDKLAIIHGNGLSDDSPHIDLWVMEDDVGSHRKRWSWTLKFTGGSYPWTLYYGGAIWRNEIVLSSAEPIDKIGRKKGLCLVNLTTNKFKMLDFCRYTPCIFLNYVESLVPVVNIKS